MTDIESGQSLASIVTAIPAAARVLERWGIDYCCHGDRPLAVATGELGVDTASVMADLLALETAPPADWATMGPAELTGHIVAAHHRYLWEELPRLEALAEKVRSVHGSNHPELTEVHSVISEMRADLEPHMTKEETVLFPAIRELAVSTTPLNFHFGTIANPISTLMRDHETQGALMDRMIEITNEFIAPPDGCASYNALYAGLKELDSDTRIHVHKENNLLFPAVQKLEAEAA